MDFYISVPEELERVNWQADLHYFEFDGIKILLDVPSGSVHIIDRITWDVLKALEREAAGEKSLPQLLDRYSWAQVREVLNELRCLKEEGLLFTRDPHLDYRPPDLGLKSLCLHVAHDCNLRCRYCFASTGPFGGGRELMPLETGQAALDFLLERSGSRKTCEVDFFGGEPLLNLPVVEKLVAYGRDKAGRMGKEIRFTLTTNGVLLDRKTENFLNRENIQLVMSVDGRPAVNDAMRPFADGRGSYDHVMPNILRVVASRNNENYYVRGTFTRYNLDFTEDIFHLADLGIKNISVEPVVAEPEADFAFQEEDLPRIKREYETLTRGLVERYAAGKPFNFFHFNIDLERGPCLPKRLTGCGAGYEYLAVTPSGEIYPCHQFVGRDQFRLGTVWQGIENRRLQEQFRQAHIYNKDECRRCWARFYCSGGCHANNYAFNRSLFKPYVVACEMQRKRLECAIYLKIYLALKGWKQAN
ncbi:thioether cross-link-forming SCIFF peptide maturase [Calderihabitans maritimus]|uniref:Radical SAM domain protein n=1 Tax=Calderihabitans maritimus TaxID=1246530 RepID=A0A1Z5HWJ5_9FIRM|nr:thioether cross-link-forming SCIFF peptide maturase [Calderihabitans maritimus]GAW93727.1 Radical SAM domain protein [Calderihabitans maritimus]